MHAPDPVEGAVEAYELAYQRVVLARKEWSEAGLPFTIEHRNHVSGIHPLWKALQEAETLCDRMRERVRVKHRGPQPKAVVTAKIGESPAAKLRSRPSAS